MKTNQATEETAGDGRPAIFNHAHHRGVGGGRDGSDGTNHGLRVRTCAQACRGGVFSLCVCVFSVLYRRAVSVRGSQRRSGVGAVKLTAVVYRLSRRVKLRRGVKRVGGVGVMRCGVEGAHN
jgi:hypothetical protein